MRFNPRLEYELEKCKENVIVVEGKNDVAALEVLGFEKIYPIHETGISLKERIEKISNNLTKKDKVCILTDFDKKGKQLFLLIKKEFQERGVKMNNRLRGILLRSGISHIEGLDEYMKNSVFYNMSFENISKT